MHVCISFTFFISDILPGHLKQHRRKMENVSFAVTALTIFITNGTFGATFENSMQTTAEPETDMKRLIRKLFDYFVVLLSLEYIFGTVMNAMILIAILKTPKLLTTPFYVIIAGLCMSECLGGLGTPLRLITNFANSVPFKLCCIIYEAIFMMVVFLNNYNLLIISCERICAVRFPVFYKNKVTVRKVVAFMAASWVFYSIVIVVAMTFGEYISSVSFDYKFVI